VEKKIPDNGFLIVASKHERFYQAAIELCDSIKLFWPEAHITLFTSHEEWIKPTDWNVADSIVWWEVPNHIRAKLWALSQTPYKGITCYLDADMDCQHEDVKDIFDQLPDDLDLIFTPIREYNAKLVQLSNTERMTMHCGMFLYRNKPNVLKLMDSWYGEFLKQQLKDEEGYSYVHDIGEYPEEARKWDTFTMWKLLTYSDHGVKWDENLKIRWNMINGHLPEELEGEEIVFWHYSIPGHEIYKDR
tara:strand:- start:21969 stop:22706 length:738 start_codon:yes stop_codon:yes gene_type:complete